MIDEKKFNQIRYSKEYVPKITDNARIDIYKKLVQSNKRILDVGCGDGYIGSILKSQNNYIVGLDGSTKAIKVASTKLDKAIEANLNTEWSLKVNEKFDVVFCGEIIEHIFDTDTFLENVKKVLNKNGILVLSTPNIASLGRRLMLLAGVSPNVETTCREKDSGHIRYFTLKTLCKLLEDRGFEIKSVSSDIVNFSKSGRFASVTLGRILPSFGSDLIVSASIKN